ncbi:MAG: hypothetical protein ABIY70_10555 [Capsulimonas sp.]|uniref:hypothetical protein n=1 Tax=Capsulimonas sp. TaxID=2494211 RepID=UPI0032634613
MRLGESTTEFSHGVMTVRIAAANVLLWRLFLAWAVLWALVTLIQIALIVTALATHSHLREAFTGSPATPLPFLLMLFYANGSFPWRCELDAKKDKITIDGWRKIPLSTVTGAHVVQPTTLIGKRPARVRHLNLETAAGRDITIRSAMVRDEEDEAKLAELALTINQYLSARQEHAKA